MKEITLALGGGGMRGIAHLGVIQFLEQQGYQIRAIAGTSSGGLVGAAYAAGIPRDQMVEITQRLDHNTFFRRGPHDGPSLMGMQGLRELLSSTIGDRNIEDLPIRFAATATDVNTGKEVILSAGPVVDALMATMALPGIFPPYEMDGMTLVDGGILDPVPVAVARWLNPGLPVIAVCLSPGMESDLAAVPVQIPITGPIPTTVLGYLSRLRWAQALHIFNQAIDAEARMLAEMRMQVERPDVIIRPDVGNYGILDPADAAELMAAGEQAAAALLSDIEEACGWGKQFRRRFERPAPPGIVARIKADTNRPHET